MFFSRSSAISSDDKPTSSFRRLSLSHNDTPTSSPRSDTISSFATSFSAAPAFLIASSDEPTSSFRRRSFSHDYTLLCWSCDAAVHDTNFLVARPVRRLACTSCHVANSDRRFSGTGTPHPMLIPALCPSCYPVDPSTPPPPPLPPPSPPPPTPTTTSSALALASVSSSSRIPGFSIFKRFLLLWCNGIMV